MKAKQIDSTTLIRLLAALNPPENIDRTAQRLLGSIKVIPCLKR